MANLRTPQKTPTNPTLRGHEIVERDGAWVYADTGEPTVETWHLRPCGHCGRHDIRDELGPPGYDGCLGKLPGVLNACCGHGKPEQAYADLADGSRVTGALVLRLPILLARA